MCKVDHLPQIYSAIPWHNSIMHFFSRELRTWVIERSTCFLFWVQYNADAHNTHAHSPFWTHVHKPYPYEHLRGNIAYHLTHNAGKFWNKFRKMWAPVPSRGLEPGWVGSTIRDLTNWSMISSRVQVFICTIVLSTIYIDIELMMNNPIYKILERQKVSKRKDRKASHCPFWTKKRKSYKRRSDSFICCLGRVYKHTHFTFGSIQAKKHTMVHVGHMRWTQKIHKPRKQNRAVHVLIQCHSPYP